MNRLLAISFACLTLLPGCNRSGLRADPPLPAFPGNVIETFDQQYCREPSGIVFSTVRGTLFVAGDEGDICELHTDGSLVQQARIRKVDLEGISLDPSTGILYAIDEHSSSILEVDPDSLAVKQRIRIDMLPAAHNRPEENRGFEAITFLPASGQQESLLLLASQGGSTMVPAIHKVTIPSPDFGTTARVLQSIELQLSDLSGLHYDHASGLVLIISDTHNALLVITTNGRVLARHALPGIDQEGITLDDTGNLYIAEDSGNIVKYSFPAMLVAKPAHTTGGSSDRPQPQ